MKTSFWHKKLGSRSAWYAALAIVSIGLSVMILWVPLSDRFFSPTAPMEDVLWTATPDYKVFFGPGTPPSVELADYLRSIEGVDQTNSFFDWPSQNPIFVSPHIFLSDADPNEIVFISPFTSDSMRFIRSEHLRSNK